MDPISKPKDSSPSVTPLVVAIDGPAGAGKSTIAERVAKRLGMTRVDTGALYRALTLVVLELGCEDEAAADLLSRLELRFEGHRIFVGDRDVSEAIRDPRVSARVSAVSAQPAVREAFLGLQRHLGRTQGRGAVLEGRDIGTVVFPDAAVKVFLTASAEERARRRMLDLHAQGIMAGHDEVLRDIRERDRKDSERTVAPLFRAPDAVLVDSTDRSIDDVVDEIVELVHAAAGSRPNQESPRSRSGDDVASSTGLPKEGSEALPSPR